MTSTNRLALSDKDTIDPDDRHEAESTLYDFTTVTMTDLLDKNHAPAVLDFVSIDVGQRVQRRLLPRAAMAPHKACALRLSVQKRSKKSSEAGGRWRRIVLGHVLAEHVLELRGRARLWP